MRGHLPLLAAVSALSVGCAPTPAPKYARDAYRAAKSINNALAISLDAAAVVKRGEVARVARAGWQKCPPLPEGAACREQVVTEVMANAKGTFDKIDAAAKLQHELAETLSTLVQCAGDTEKMPDSFCEVGMLKSAADKIPVLVEAVSAIRKEAENVTAAQ